MKIYEEFERDRFEHGRQQTITKWRFEFQWKEQNFFFWTGKKYLRNIRRKLNRERMGWDYKYGFDTGQTFYIYKYSVCVLVCVRCGEVRWDWVKLIACRTLLVLFCSQFSWSAYNEHTNPTATNSMSVQKMFCHLNQLIIQNGFKFLCLIFSAV